MICLKEKIRKQIELQSIHNIIKHGQYYLFYFSSCDYLLDKHLCQPPLTHLHLYGITVLFS